jgi:hypothetical protein
MFSGKFFLTALMIAVAVSLIQWFFIGFLFHKYQSATPQTWRPESGRSYAASTIVSLFFGFMFTTVMIFWMGKYGPMHLFNGLEFGFVCWASFSLPLEIGNAIYVNYSRMFVAGKCMSSFVEYIAAGALAMAVL